MSDRLFALAGAGLAFLAVALGAFAAHALSGSLAPDDLVTFQTAVRYQMHHALALLFVSWAAVRWPGALTRASGWFFIVGIVFFSGSLFVLAFGGPSWMGAVAPFGGLCLLAGWAVLALRIVLD